MIGVALIALVIALLVMVSMALLHEARYGRHFCGMCDDYCDGTCKKYDMKVDLHDVCVEGREE